MNHDLVLFAKALAQIAGEIVASGFRKRNHITPKCDGSLVSQIDYHAEKEMRNLITKTYPNHAIIGEEFGILKDGSDWCWVLDPIDGTLAYLAGKPQFATLIALLYRSVPVLGLMHQPVNCETWFAYDSQSYFNEVKLSRSHLCPLNNAIIATTSPDYFSLPKRIIFDKVAQSVAQVTYGGDCYNYALLASGFINCVMESNLKFYDIAPFVPIIEGAGGKITDWSGNPLNLRNCKDVLAASDPILHGALLAIIESTGMRQ